MKNMLEHIQTETIDILGILMLWPVNYLEKQLSLWQITLILHIPQIRNMLQDTTS